MRTSGSKRQSKSMSKKPSRRMATASSAHFHRLHPHRVSSAVTTASTSSLTQRKRKRSNADSDDNDNNNSASGKKSKRGACHGENSSFLDVVDGFHAIVAATHSTGSGSGAASHAAFAEVLEWVGDAVIGEIVGRCLLSQFHHAPLSARVFRNLRLAVVTNRNLAQVYDAMSYERRRYHHVASGGGGDPRKKRKERADVVEAVVGELVVRLARQSNDLRACALYRDHLDALVAAMLHAHFADRTRAQQLGASAGPLRVAVNPFACLPEEQLDEATGELVILQGSFGDADAAAADDGVSGPTSAGPHAALQDKSFADLLDEYTESNDVDAARCHHAFVPLDSSASDVESDTEGGERLAQRTRVAMRSIGADHVLRASREVFEVFKVYGMTVLAERVSLALALPHLARSGGSGGGGATEPRALAVTPAALTHARQRVLSVANLAHCATLLGVALTPMVVDCTGDTGGADADAVFEAQRVADERLRANTLRAFVGFHSAVATTSSAAKTHSSELVNGITQCLQAQVQMFSIRTGGDGPQALDFAIPDREPLGSLLRSVSETKLFMRSATCDALHLPGERPVSAADAARAAANERRRAFVLRQCDSEQVEDLFETLAAEHERERQRLASRDQQQRRAKQTSRAKQRQNAGAADGGSGSGTNGPLAANLSRFAHRRFLFCLESIVVLFAQRETDACRRAIAAFACELEPCADSASLRKWDVSTSTLTLAMRDSFYRLLLHDICHFHAVASSSKTTRDGTRVTQLRLPLHYSWAKIARRITTEAEATS